MKPVIILSLVLAAMIPTLGQKKSTRSYGQPLITPTPVPTPTPPVAITFVNVSAKVEGQGNITLNAPASPQTDDIWIAVVGSSNATAFTGPSGWTQIVEGGNNARLGVWWFRYAGSTPNLVVSQSGTTARAGAIFAFRNCKLTGSPVNVLDSLNSQISSNDPSMEVGSITPTVANCMLVFADATDGSPTRSPIPTSFTTVFEDSAGGTQNAFVTNVGTPALECTVAAFRKTHTTGATGVLVDTQSGAGTPWVSVIFALEPEFP